MDIDKNLNEKDDQWNDVLLKLDELNYEELRELYLNLSEEEQRVSYKRRILHGRIDILKTEMVKKIKEDYSSSAITPDKLAEALAQGGTNKRPPSSISKENLF